MAASALGPGVSVCMNPLRAVSQFALAFWVLWPQSLLLSKPDDLGACLTGADLKSWGA